ncbi:MAG: Asp-tRNA(Asn)/Glu-tRNA(Gln) amidotransferase subunit GatA [Bacillota bacterium]|nr:Asp-tRNA(Asn)/Glu-tRNA(Gln) amidotransferase subunit GatA [Bacillota bacterium]
MKLHHMTVSQVADRIRKREISSEEVTRYIIDRIKEVDDRVGAYITVTEEQALAKAREVDRLIGEGEALADIAGVPMALKDNMCTEDIKTTCASNILNNFVPPYSATVYSRLDRAGGVLVGKTNMDEFAMGSSTENSGFKKTYNPWDLQRVPGGSSGGSAAAVASGTAFFALGSDTGGSIRQPAALCGVVGMKPTYGRVSRYGLVAFASSLDQIGPITRDVTDCAIVLNHISGYDEFDSTSVDLDVPDFTRSLKGEIKGFRVAIPAEYFAEGIDPHVKNTVMAAIKDFEKLGAVCEEVSLPHTEYALAAYYIIASAEASSNLARYDGIRYGYRAEGFKDLKDLFVATRSRGFGDEVKRRIMLGTYALSSGYYDAYYKKAQKVRTLVKQDFDRVFDGYDVVVCPTSPTVAFKAGEKTHDPLQMYLSDVYTIPVNIAGLPGISVPCGFVDGLPVGLQIIGKPFDEGTVLAAAYAYEQNTGHNGARPQI